LGCDHINALYKFTITYFLTYEGKMSYTRNELSTYGIRSTYDQVNVRYRLNTAAGRPCNTDAVDW